MVVTDPFGRSGKDLVETDLQPADDLALLAVNALISAWTLTSMEKTGASGDNIFR